MVINKFQARHGAVAYSPSGAAITWDTTAAINEETMTGVSEVKDITVTTPETAVESIALLGNKVQTVGINQRVPPALTGIMSGTHQLRALVATSISNYKFEGTLVLTGDEQFIHILGLDAGIAINTNTDQRYAVGNLASATGAWAQKLVGCMRIFLNNGVEDMSVGMSNLWVTKIGDIKPTGSDGHFEIDFSCECLPQDGAIEWKI